MKMGNYEDALAAFEECLDAGGTFTMALNLTLTVSERGGGGRVGFFFGWIFGGYLYLIVILGDF